MNLQEKAESLLAVQTPSTTPLPELRIGLVGAGNITRVHLKGYAWAGIPVAAITDLNAETARQRAKEFGIPAVAEDLEALVARDDVDVLDVNFPGNARLPVVERIAKAGKPVLVQKPLADDYETARQMVEICEAAQVPLAVNMNARFSPVYRSARRIVEAGLLGQVYHGFHRLCSNHDGMPHHAAWLTEPERYQILQFGVHHIDAVNAWFGGQPRSVTATTTRKPGQQFRGEMMANLAFAYGDHAGADLLEYNALHATRPYASVFEIQGTRGALLGDFAGTLHLYHEELGEGEGHVLRPEGNWFPNAFGMVMADFLRAVAHEKPPEASGRQHLEVLRTIEGCYRSLAERRTVDSGEFLG